MISYTIHDRLFLKANELVLPLVYIGSTGSEDGRWQIFGPRPLVGARIESFEALLSESSGIIEDHMAAAASRSEVFLWRGKALDTKSMRQFMSLGLQRSLTVEEFVLQTGHPCIGLYTVATGTVYPRDSSELYAILTSVDLERLETVPWAKDKYKVWPASVYSPCRLYYRHHGSKYYLGEYRDKEVTGWKMSDNIRKAAVFTDPTAAFEKMDQLGIRYLRPALHLERAEERSPQIAYVIVDESGRFYTHTSGGSIWLTGIAGRARVFRDSKTANAFLLEKLFNGTVGMNNTPLHFSVCPVYLDQYGKADRTLYNYNEKENEK